MSFESTKGNAEAQMRCTHRTRRVRGGYAEGRVRGGWSEGRREPPEDAHMYKLHSESDSQVQRLDHFQLTMYPTSHVLGGLGMMARI